MSGAIAERGGIPALLQENKSQKNKMMITGAIALSALVAFIILGSLALNDYVKIGGLKDRLHDWERLASEYPDPAYGCDLQILPLRGEISHLTSVATQNFNCGIALLAIALVSASASIYYYRKKKESDGKLQPEQLALQEIPSDQKEAFHRKRAKIGAAVAAVALVTFIVLVSLAISSHLKVKQLWDRWHEWRPHGGNDLQTGAALQEQIKHTTLTGWQEFGFSMAFLATALGAGGYAIYHSGKSKQHQAEGSSNP